MNEVIKCHFHDQMWLSIEASSDNLHSEISDHFQFTIPNIDVLKRTNKKFWFWDGRIRLYNKRKKLLPYGLIRKLKLFCDSNDYTLEVDDTIKANSNFNVTEEQIEQFVDNLALPFEIRDYQLAATIKAIRNKRLTIIAPTSSGKSNIIYNIAMWIQKNDLKENEKILIIVPNKGLLVQLKNNFEEYGYKGTLHCIQAGVEKDSEVQVSVTLENGTTVSIPGNENITLINNSCKIAKNLTYEDEINDGWLRTFLSKQIP